MKTVYTFLLIACTATLFSCKKDLTGSGSVITEQRQAGGNFTAVTSKGDFNIILKKAQATAIELSGEDNVLPKVVTEISNGNLTIRYENSINTHAHKQVVVTVGLPSLLKVQLDGSGMIRSDESWQSPDFTAILNGSGNIDISSQGDTYSGEIIGSGKLKMNGTSRSTSAHVSGSGYINAYAFTTDNADVKIDGSGKCEIKVTNKLKARISGSGKVYYKGNPDTNVFVTGSGGAVKVN